MLGAETSTTVKGAAPAMPASGRGMIARPSVRSDMVIGHPPIFLEFLEGCPSNQLTSYTRLFRGRAL